MLSIYKVYTKNSHTKNLMSVERLLYQNSILKVGKFLTKNLEQKDNLPTQTLVNK